MISSEFFNQPRVAPQPHSSAGNIERRRRPSIRSTSRSQL
jgi:hypothetical protein